MSPVTGARLDLSRAAVLALRRRVGFLDDRLPGGAASLMQAASAGLQDSMPRAALLSLHARVAGVGPTAWEDPSLVQLWGPRFSVFVVPARAVAPFSLGTLPDDASGQRRAQELAQQLAAVLAGRRLRYGEAGQALGIHPNRLRYAAATGTVRLRWDGARQPLVWTVPPPAMTVASARLELSRRYVHVYGPTTPSAFSQWAGLPARSGARAFWALASELMPVATPIGEAWMLARDEDAARAPATPPPRCGFCPAGIRSCCGRERTGRCWCRTPPSGQRCGRPACGPEACCLRASRRAPGAGRGPRSRWSRGAGSRTPSVRPSRPRCRRCRWPARSRFSGWARRLRRGRGGARILQPWARSGSTRRGRRVRSFPRSPSSAGRAARRGCHRGAPHRGRARGPRLHRRWRLSDAPGALPALRPQVVDFAQRVFEGEAPIAFGRFGSAAQQRPEPHVVGRAHGFIRVPSGERQEALGNR